MIFFPQQPTKKILKELEPESLSVLSNHKSYDAKPIRSAVPSANGQFKIDNVAPGKYLLRPFSQNKNIKFHIQPEFIEFVVTSEPLTLPQTFEITGFSVSGRVLSTENGFGIGKARVLLNGNPVATTHTDGSYTLENIKAGTYTITAQAADVQFEQKSVEITLKSSNIPDIVVSAFKVCGQVLSQDSYTIAITKHSSTFHTQATSQRDTGEWCTYLPTGRYSVQILTSAEDTARGIQFFPKTQNIEVVASPVSGIIFSQLRATVTGDVKCLTDAEGAAYCQNTVVTLHALDSDGRRNGATVKATVKNGKYSFAEVRPGTYEVSVPTTSLCWESNTLTLNVKSATETIPTFVHSGYLVSIVSSHNTKMTYILRSATHKIEKEIFLTAGLNSFCVDNFGVYDISFKGCHTYDSTTQNSFRTGDELPINVNALKHINGVRVLSDIRSAFKLLVEQNGEQRTVELKEESQKVDGKFSYRHEFSLKADEKLSLKPLNDVVLFSPSTAEIIGANDCVDNTFTFTAAKGLIINGKVTPPIDGVRVTLNFPRNQELQALVAITSADGRFKFGPLDEQLAVELSAEKESYVFSGFDSARGEFKAHKLCEIIVTVKDEQGKLLPGVLLSLSGGESYRKNLVTGDDGVIKFHSLSPSQYFLRPMMKEYRFEPTSKIIDVKDGETVRVGLNGKRVSFSVFGAVTSLNGEPFADVIVEARSEARCGQHQEEATTEANGQYRIRGLQPNCEYTIRVRTEGEQAAQVDRTVPTEQKVVVTKEDVHNINIIAINALGYVDVIARVNAANNEHYKTLRVQLYKKENRANDVPIHTQRVESPLNIKGRVNPGIMIFFPRIPFDGKTYTVELTTTLSDKNFKFDLPIVPFQANRSTVYVELDFTPEIRLSEGDLNQNSISALILLGLIIIAFFKQELAGEFLALIWTKISALATTIINNAQKKRDTRHEIAYNENEIDKLAQSINATKKKNVRKA